MKILTMITSPWTQISVHSSLDLADHSPKIAQEKENPETLLITLIYLRTLIRRFSQMSLISGTVSALTHTQASHTHQQPFVLHIAVSIYLLVLSFCLCLCSRLEEKNFSSVAWENPVCEDRSAVSSSIALKEFYWTSFLHLPFYC